MFSSLAAIKRLLANPMPTRVVGLDSKQSARVGYLDISCLDKCQWLKEKGA
ncbi:hypothetical protein HMPREF1574_00992 [Gardnerella pickettii JCP7659]|nr:hypothetical protein HMPREF1574_00992 [Gardnerella pickettii JCP7659]EPI61107.1 hypothetical protein HMPREF1578_01071 [Gardnerella pickettii JCP8017B]